MFFICQTIVFSEESVPDMKRRIKELEDKNKQLEQELNEQKKPLFPWEHNLYSEMQKIQREMNEWFNDSIWKRMEKDKMMLFTDTTLFEPSVDIKEEKDKYIIKIEIPGMEKDKIDITVEGHQLMVSGERKAETEKSEEKKDEKYHKRELSYGYF